MVGRLQGVENQLFGNPLPQGWALMPYPEKESWLARVPERGQNLKQFLTSQFRNPVVSSRRVLYLREIDWPYLRCQVARLVSEDELAYMDQVQSMMSSLSQFALCMRAFLRMETFQLLPLQVDLDLVTTRKSGNRLQFRTSDLQKLLVESGDSVPGDDCYALIGICALDLYANDHNAGLLGEATLDERVALCSMYRVYLNSELSLERMHRNAYSLVIHETLHMGMRHCIHFLCVLNGGFPHPLILCPPCLQKLHHHLPMSPAEHITRYRDLLEFWGSVCPNEGPLQFIEKRLSTLERHI